MKNRNLQTTPYPLHQVEREKKNRKKNMKEPVEKTAAMLPLVKNTWPLPLGESVATLRAVEGVGAYPAQRWGVKSPLDYLVPFVSPCGPYLRDYIAGFK